MTIGAVIVTHNSENHITSCAQSVRQEGVSHIVVVDSASMDRTLQIVNALGVQTIPLPHNKGFGYAANKGAHMLNTDYVLFLNPDANLASGALEHVTKLLTRDSTIGIIGMMLQAPSGVPERYCFGDEPSLSTIMGRKYKKDRIPNKPMKVDWVSGGAMVIARNVFTQIGGFDESFFLYWEDIDLCKRARKAGGTVWLHPDAVAIHARGASQEDSRVKTLRYDTSADRYYKKHYPTPIWLLQRILRKVYRHLSPQTY